MSGKGQAFERLICRRLSEWVTAGAKSDCFWRSAMSGGRATVHQRKGLLLRQSGDITSVAPEGHGFTDTWFVECKFRKDLALRAFFTEGKGKLAAWWHTARDEAIKYDKLPMVIARQNRCPTLVVMPTIFAPNTVLVQLNGIYCTVLQFDRLMEFSYDGFDHGRFTLVEEPARQVPLGDRGHAARRHRGIPRREAVRAR